MTHINIPQVVFDMHPDAIVRFEGRSYGDMVWLDTKIAKPTLKEIEDFYNERERLIRVGKDRVLRISALHKLEEKELRKEAEKLAEVEIENIKSAQSLKSQEIKQAILDAFHKESLDREELEVNNMWLEITEQENKKHEEAKSYLEATNHMIVYCPKCLHEEEEGIAKDDVLA